MTTSARLALDFIGTDRTQAAFASLNRNLAKAQLEQRKFGLLSKSTFDTFSRGIAQAGALMGVTFGVGLLGAFARSAIKDLAAIKDQAERASISIKDLQELTFAARQGGGTQDDVVDLFQKFNRELANAKEGTGKLGGLLAANNISLEDGNGKLKTNKELFLEVVDLVKNTANETDRAAVMQAAFRRGAEGALPWLLEGAEAITRQADKAHELGVVIGDEVVKKAAEFDDEWTQVWDRWEAKGKSSIVVVADYYDDFLKRVDKFTFDTFGRPFGGKDPNELDLKNMPAPLSNLADKGNLYATHTKLGKTEEEIAAEKKLAAAKDAAAKAFANVIEALLLERSEIGRGSLVKEEMLQLDKAGTTAATDQGKSIIALVQANARLATQEQNRLDLLELATAKQEEFAASLDSLAHTGADAFERWAVEGEKLNDVLLDLAKSLFKMMTQAALFGEGPFAAIFGTGKSSGGAGGIFGSLIGSFTGTGGGISPSQSALGTPLSLYADGGVLGAGKWGIAGEAGQPELIHGPATITPMDSGQVVFQVINQNGSRIEQREKKMPDGRRVLMAIVREALPDAMKPVMKSQYGLTPKNQRR